MDDTIRVEHWQDEKSVLFEHVFKVRIRQQHSNNALADKRTDRLARMLSSCDEDCFFGCVCWKREN